MSALILVQIYMCDCYNHIGVGSNVVCSAIPGNAKASVRGTDDRTVPTSFLCSYDLNVVLKDVNWGRYIYESI